MLAIKLVEGFLGRKLNGDDTVKFTVKQGFLRLTVKEVSVKDTSREEIEGFLIVNDDLDPVVKIGGECCVKYMNNQLFYTKA